MIDVRSVAVEGIGYGALSVAVLGFVPASDASVRPVVEETVPLVASASPVVSLAATETTIAIGSLPSVVRLVGRQIETVAVVPLASTGGGTVELYVSSWETVALAALPSTVALASSASAPVALRATRPRVGLVASSPEVVTLASSRTTIAIRGAA